jgi:nucleotide-binding universal stress UspA family protein
MKTIAILTDLSDNSARAAMYALHLAKKIQAKVVLYNVCAALAPKAELVPSSAYVTDDDSDTESDVYDKLLPWCINLQNEFKAGSFPGSFLPEVTFDSSSDEIVDIMTSIVNNENVILIVASTSVGEDISGFVQSDRSRKIIDWANVPLLVVPPDLVDIRNPEKIAFVSTIEQSDTDHLNSIVNILEPFAPELMVSYLAGKAVRWNNTVFSEDSRLSYIVSAVNYGRTYYRKIPGERHLTSWQWLWDHKKCDIIVLPPQSPGELNEFLSSGNSPHITHHVPIPVMILPALR